MTTRAARSGTMAGFGTEAMFEQIYDDDMNEYINDLSASDTSLFAQDHSFLMSKFTGIEEQNGMPSSTASPSLSLSQTLQPSVSTMPHLSIVSGNSTTSSSMGSPFLTMHQESEHQLEDWTRGQWGLRVEPDIFHQDDGLNTDFNGGHLDSSSTFQARTVHKPMNFGTSDMEHSVDLPLFGQHFAGSFSAPCPDVHTDVSIRAFPGQSPMPVTHSIYETPSVGAVPSHTDTSLSNTTLSHNSLSRRPSVGSMESTFSRGSPQSITTGFEDESAERGLCTYAGCGRVFKDLRAHKLTHQSERPEKCPIEKCQYHTKGFARKYDQTRHTLTHYKGTMVCGFCPGSGSATEKSFNRADVFKRHLTSVHGVEQTPSNSRRKSPAAIKKTSSKDENKEGKCSTCGAVFSSAQEFYNHLDDCVMRILEKPDVSEAHNQRHLMEVLHDHVVRATLERNNLPIEVENGDAHASTDHDKDIDEDGDDASENMVQALSGRDGISALGLTRSKGGVPTVSKGRRKRKDYPHSWGCGKEQMKMKKRVLCVFDGQRRLWKDEMMMDNDFEVRVPLPSSETKYVTDLDVMTLKKAEALHNATAEERGPWHRNEEITKLML